MLKQEKNTDVKNENIDNKNEEEIEQLIKVDNHE